MGRNSTGEVVQEIPQDSEATELQVPLRAQVPATADRPALSLSFRSAGDVQRGVTRSTHSTTGCPSEQTCWRSPPFSRLYLFQTASYLTNYTSSKDATLTSTTLRTVATLTTTTRKLLLYRWPTSKRNSGNFKGITCLNLKKLIPTSRRNY